MSTPLVKKDLLESILELREDVERQLRANKYYIALHKLDELLEAIRPLDIIESTATPAETPRASPEPSAPAEPEPSAAAAPQAEERVWTGVVEEQVGDPGWHSQSGAATAGDEARAS
jgi:hypothetical protein